jgi:hypothetical protein
LVTAFSDAPDESTIEGIYKHGILGFGSSGADDRCVYVVGIIDLLQEWNFSKKFERGVKVMSGREADALSAVEPDKYAARFKEAIFARLQ